MYQNDPLKVLTGKVRASYAHLTTPRAIDAGAEPKYGVTLLIPKSDLATKAEIDSAIQAAIQDGIQNKWNGVRPPIIRIPIYDGDGARPSTGEPFGDECKGHWVMTASSKQKPEVVDLSLSPILNASDIYSGMYIRVTIRFFAFANAGNKGVGCGLNNVLKVEDGEPLSGHENAASDFSGIVSGAAPAYPQYPQSAAVPYYPPQPPYPQHAAPVPATPPNYAAPVAQTPPPPYYPAQPAPAQYYPQIDPITGQPIPPPIMGL
ncbi:MAG: DUF2815 family protein [Eubacteriales bacterium]